MNNVVQGTRVVHDRYGEGLVNKVNLTDYEIFFENMGKINVSMKSSELIIKESPADAPAAIQIDANQLDGMLRSFFDTYVPLPEIVELGEKWMGGTLVLKPSNDELQGKEIPTDTFFHKIVMLRDKLRVLEQNINAHKVLSDEEKVHLQQYISRVYGTLTTFNVLFKNKEDQFKS